VSCEECTVSCVQYNLILDAERLCMDAERLCIVYNDVRTANDVGSIRSSYLDRGAARTCASSPDTAREQHLAVYPVVLQLSGAARAFGLLSAITHRLLSNRELMRAHEVIRS
jgi:hypothetical protein